MRAFPLGDSATRLGGYELVLELASEESTVLLARKTGPRSFSRWVTIRCLGPFTGAEAELLESIDRDMRRASRVRHPCVLPLLEAGTIANGRFIVSDYIEGGSLLELMEGGPLHPSIARAIVSDVLAGLEAVFRAEDDRGRPLELVHGRVEPSRILVGLDGRSRLADAGLPSTPQGATARAFRYASPEVIDGRVPTRRSDVFSIGMILHEVLLGHHPLPAATSKEDHRRALTEPLPLLSVVRPDISPALAEVVARAVALDAAHRYASAESLATALERAAPAASFRQVGACVEDRIGARVEERRRLSGAWLSSHAAAIGEPTPARAAEGRRRARSVRARRHRLALILALFALATLVGIVTAALLRD